MTQDYITLEKIDPVIFFRGTEEQQAAEEVKAERNDRDLYMLYNLVLNGGIAYAYTITAHSNGNKSFYILHQSAKYADGLQYTAGTMDDNGNLLYMTYDCHITDFNKFLDEFHHGDGKRVYFSELETV